MLELKDLQKNERIDVFDDYLNYNLKEIEKVKKIFLDFMQTHGSNFIDIKGSNIIKNRIATELDIDNLMAEKYFNYFMKYNILKINLV